MPFTLALFLVSCGGVAAVPPPAAGLERHPSRKLYLEREGDFRYDHPDHLSFVDRAIGADIGGRVIAA